MKSLFTCFVHIAALNAFAVAQPVFDRLSSNPEYLRLQGYSGIAIAVVLSLFLLVIPIAATACVAVLQSLKLTGAAALTFATSGTLLAALIINITLRWFQWRFELRGAGVPDSLIAGMSVPLAAGCAWLYRRHRWPGQCLNLAAVGIVLFPLSLLSSPAMRVEVFGMDSKKTVSIHAGNPVPIVMIVFDGMCGMSLLNERHEIDAVRYPSFARLAQSSTFYRNATSVHCRTTQALPAILTGQFPEAQQISPVESNHPDNLFRMIYETDEYEMTVFEPFTRLCPDELKKADQTLSFVEEVAQATYTLAHVYFVTTAPSDLGFLQPRIPGEWFGIVKNEQRGLRRSKGLITYGWDSSHDIQLEHFTRSLVTTQRPGFHFLHIVAPHDPWSHLPSGNRYMKSYDISEPVAGIVGGRNESGDQWGSDELMVQQGWRRYLLQLQYLDRCLGQIMDRLEAIDEFDRSLLVVVADHGMAFVPGEERRIPTNATLADVMSVPLFIKQPEQRIGETSDLSVETIDVLPTIADIIKLPLPGPVDGVSLVAKDFQERPRKSMQSDHNQLMVVNPEFTQRFSYVDRMLAVFGSGSHDDRLWNRQTMPEPVGIEVSAATIGTPSRWNCRLHRGGDKSGPVAPGFIPCYFLGNLVGPEITQPVQIAIAVNGRVEYITRTSLNSGASQEWTALLPEDSFRTDMNKVRLFEVEHSDDGVVLHEIAY